MIVYQPTAAANNSEPIRARLDREDIETLVSGQPLELHVVFDGVLHVVALRGSHSCTTLRPCGDCLDELQTETRAADAHNLRCQPGNECERCRVEIEHDMATADETDPSYGVGGAL